MDLIGYGKSLLNPPPFGETWLISRNNLTSSKTICFKDQHSIMGVNHPCLTKRQIHDPFIFSRIGQTLMNLPYQPVRFFCDPCNTINQRFQWLSVWLLLARTFRGMRFSLWPVNVQKLLVTKCHQEGVFFPWQTPFPTKGAPCNEQTWL